MFNSTFSRGFLSLLFLFPTVSFALTAPQSFKSPRSKVRLVTNVDSIDANTRSFYAALHFKLSKDWHIYWKNSGDSGTPPSYDWEGSSTDLSFSDILWPSPKRIPVAPLMSYGYEEEVVLPVEITLSKSPDEAKTLKLKASWLICKIECIPESQNFELRMPLSNQSTVSQESALIQKFISKQAERVADLKAELLKKNAHFELIIESKNIDLFSQAKNLYFYSEEGLRVKHSAEQKILELTPNTAKLEIERDENDDDTKNSIAGILEISNEKGQPQYLALNTDTHRAPFDMNTLLISLIFAFIGGLLLNLMPCVFPVLFLKLYALTKNHSLTPKQRKLEAWAYGAGVVVSFLVLAIALLVLKSIGLAVGWGFQLQSPVFVAAAFLLFVAMGLSLMGLYEFSGSFTGKGQALTQKSGLQGSFFTGVLATLVATPCSAPFMGSAVGYALTRSPSEALLVFVKLGAGLAFPYIVLAYFPALLKWIPKPGAWMERVKEFFGFALFGTALWLLWIFSTQQSSDALINLLISALFLSLGLWALRLQRKKVKLIFLVTSFLASLYFLQLAGRAAPAVAVESSKQSEWENFNPEKLTTYLNEGKAVFIDFTASWCLTCQVNKKLVLNTAEADKLFDEAEVIRIRADWTNYDPLITQTLAKLGRQSVPVYAYYEAGTKKPVLLPELLTLDILRKHIITKKEDR